MLRNWKVKPESSTSNLLHQTYFSDFQKSCIAKPWLVCTDREVLKLYLVKLLLLESFSVSYSGEVAHPLNKVDLAVQSLLFFSETL